MTDRGGKMGRKYTKKFRLDKNIWEYVTLRVLSPIKIQLEY